MNCGWGILPIVFGTLYEFAVCFSFMGGDHSLVSLPKAVGAPTSADIAERRVLSEGNGAWREAGM